MKSKNEVFVEGADPELKNETGLIGKNCNENTYTLPKIEKQLEGKNFIPLSDSDDSNHHHTQAEHKKITSGDAVLKRLISCLSKLGYFEIVNDDKKMEKFIQNLTLSSFTKLLTIFNALVRDIPLSKKGTYNDKKYKMEVSDWLAPSIEVRDQIIPELLNAIKQLKSYEKRASLLYYLLICLHMFEDGNGRTARLFYNLLIGNADLTNDIYLYVHVFGEKYYLDEPFETKVGILQVQILHQIISKFLLEELSKYPEAREAYFKAIPIKTEICTSTVKKEGVYGEIIPIPLEIRQQLTEEELMNIDTLLLDNSGTYTVGGLTMLIMATKKGQIQKWIDIFEKHKSSDGNSAVDGNEKIKYSFVFLLDDISSPFDSWTANDYREAIKIGDSLKKAYLINLIRIFTNPYDYELGRKTYLDVILPRNNEAKKRNN